MKRLTFVLGMVLLLSALSPMALSNPKPQALANLGPAETVKAFYSYHFSHNKCYDEACLRRRRRWLTAELYNLLMYELHRKLPPDTVGYIEGDPFTSSEETPDSFRIGKSTRRGDWARVEVFVYWHWKGRLADQRKYSFDMVREGGRWRIADIIDHEGTSLRDNLTKLKREDSQS